MAGEFLQPCGMKLVHLGEAALDRLMQGAHNSSDGAQDNVCGATATLLLLLLCLLLTIRHHRTEKDHVPGRCCPLLFNTAFSLSNPLQITLHTFQLMVVGKERFSVHIMQWFAFLSFVSDYAIYILGR